MFLLYFCLLASLISPPMFLVWLEYIVHAWTCLPLLKTPQLLPTAPGIKANVLNISLVLPAQPDCSHTFFQPQWPLCSSLFLGILCPTTGPLHLLFLPLTELKFSEQSHHLQTVTSCLSNSLRLRSDFSYTFNLQIKSLRSTEGQMPPICIIPVTASHGVPSIHWLALRGEGRAVDRQSLGMGTDKVGVSGESTLWNN